MSQHVTLFDTSGRGLFEKDKTLFSFALCIRIMKGERVKDVLAKHQDAAVDDTWSRVLHVKRW